MNLFQLEYFITLAETLSYTKASQHLHITQPTLSKLIINLEHMIGSQLFVRNKRDVKLTPAGKVFYTEIKKTLSSYDDAVQKVKDMENGTTGVINMGFLGTALVKPLPVIINRFREKYPTIQINPVDYGYSKMMESLADNQIDVAILPDLELDNVSNLSKKTLFTDGMCLVVHKNHKFAGLESVEAADLKDEPLINMDARASRRDHNLINRICTNSGFIPNTIYEAYTLLNMLVMVECRIGITIMASHMSSFASESIRFVPLRGLEHAFNVVCIHGETMNESVPKLLDVIEECFPLQI